MTLPQSKSMCDDVEEEGICRREAPSPGPGYDALPGLASVTHPVKSVTVGRVGRPCI